MSDEKRVGQVSSQIAKLSDSVEILGKTIKSLEGSLSSVLNPLLKKESLVADSISTPKCDLAVSLINIEDKVMGLNEIVYNLTERLEL